MRGTSVALHWCFRQALLVAKVGAGTAAIVLALVAVLVALPRLIDWQDLRPKLGLALSSATGRVVTFDGPLSVEFLPWPTLRTSDVRIANAPGAATRTMFEARRLSVRLSLKALTRGRLEISSIVLDEPRLAIEPGPDGRPNWWLPALEADGGGAATGLPVTLDTVEVRGGRLLHAIGLVDQPLEAHDVDFVVTIDSQRGQVGVKGTAVVNGLPTTAFVRLRTGAASGPPLALQADVPGGRVTFEGWTGQRSDADPLHGRMSVTSKAPAILAASLAQLMGRPTPRLDDALFHRVEASADASFGGQRFSIEGLSVAVDDVQIDGNLEGTVGESPVISGHLSVPSLDADQWIERLRAHPLLSGAQAGRESNAPASLPVPRLDLVVQVTEARYRRDVVRNVVAAFKSDADGFHVREVMAMLPGDCRLYYRIDQDGQARADRPDVVEIDAHRLRETLKWIGIDTASVPAGRLQRLQLTGRTRVHDGAVLMADATFALDDQAGTGTASAALTLPTTISGQFDLPRFDLDSYRLTERALQKMISSPAGSPGSAPAEIAPPQIDISARIDEVTYRGQAVHDVDARFTIRGNHLTLAHVGVGNLLGSRLEISGSVEDFVTSPRFDLTWRGVLPDVDRVLDYAGLPRFARGRIGAGQTSGRAVGTLGEVQLSDFSLDMLNARITAAGEVSFGAELRFDFPRWSLVTPEVGVIAAVASGTARRPIAELRATGSFRGDGHRVQFQGDIALDGMKLSGALASTLDRYPTLSVALRAQQTLRLDRWLPPPPLSGAANTLHGWASSPVSEAEPAWLSTLKTFNGDLSLTAPAVAWGPYEMTGFDLSAHLHGGRLTVERFAGALGEATVRLSGAVDTQQASVAFSVDGELRDIDISRIIAVAHTANDFGTDELAVALHGKISLEDLALRANGATLKAALLSLSGKGRTTGQIQPVVTRGSLSLASLATGLGSLFSSEMGFASAVIENFVGRWMQSQGALEVGSGVVYLREYLFEGDKAKALIRGQIDATNSSVDTRIELDGKDGSARYSMSLRGPVHAPKLESDTSGRR